jgi:hypothetical protein
MYSSKDSGVYATVKSINVVHVETIGDKFEILGC